MRSTRGFGDLVAMPLPEQWGPTVVPTGSVMLPTIPTVPAGSTMGWQRVNGGWLLCFKARNGNVTPVPGAQVVAYPGASPSNDGMSSDETQSYLGNGAAPSTNPGLMVIPPTTAPISRSASAPGGAWERQPVVPDSMLPQTLQRGNPLVRQTVWRPNGYDAAIRNQASMWAYVRAHGGLKSCCRIPELGAPVWSEPPWMVQPSQGEKFEEMFSQPTSAFQSGGGDFTGVDVILGQFVVPNGYDGALNRVVCNFTGNGFQDFMGFISWRVQVNNRFARNLGNIQNTFGDFKTAFSVPGSDNIRLVSQQTITLLANIPPGSPVSDGVVAAGAFGWFYPRR